MAEEGFLRACLAVVGGVELLFLASFSSCNFEMAEGFSILDCCTWCRDFIFGKFLSLLI
jgi:hypothetical protein